jgi:hypothetical protein
VIYLILKGPFEVANSCILFFNFSAATLHARLLFLNGPPTQLAVAAALQAPSFAKVAAPFGKVCH